VAVDVQRLHAFLWPRRFCTTLTRSRGGSAAKRRRGAGRERSPVSEAAAGRQIGENRVRRIGRPASSVHTSRAGWRFGSGLTVGNVVRWGPGHRQRPGAEGWSDARPASWAERGRAAGRGMVTKGSPLGDFAKRERLT
jgi:hypothetical protein